MVDNLSVASENNRVQRVRSVRFYLFWGVVFATAAVVLLGLWGFIASKSQVQRHLDKLSAAGLPVTAKQVNDYYVIPEGVFDSTSLWITAINLTRFPESAVPKDLPVLGPKGADIPAFSEPWLELEMSRDFVNSNGKSLAAIHEAADAGGQVRFPVNFSGGINTLLTMTQETRNCARMLMLDSLVKARDGDDSAAHRDILALFALSEAMRGEPTHVSQLVRIAIYRIVCNQIESLMPHMAWSDAQLVELQKAANAADFTTGVMLGINGERAIVNTTLQSTVPLPLRASNQRETLAYYADMETAVSKSWTAAIAAGEKADVRLKKLNQSLISRFRYQYTATLVSSLKHIVNAGARAAASQRSCYTLIALRRYQLAHQSLPDNIGDLVPNYLDEIPTDPFDDRPLRYKVDANAVTVYSIGIDGKDDDGDEKPNAYGPDHSMVLQR